MKKAEQEFWKWFSEFQLDLAIAIDRVIEPDTHVGVHGGCVEVHKNEENEEFSPVVGLRV